MIPIAAPQTAEEWLSIWKTQPGWSTEWMLQFIKDIQESARKNNQLKDNHH